MTRNGPDPSTAMSARRRAGIGLALVTALVSGVRCS